MDNYRTDKSVLCVFDTYRGLPRENSAATHGLVIEPLTRFISCYEAGLMDQGNYCVHVVVDPNFGERLRELPAGEPVWIIESAVNEPAVAGLWKERPTDTYIDGITKFWGELESPPEENLIAELWSIDLHHGEYSHDPPYSVLHVIGARWSAEIGAALEEYGFELWEETGDGFVARRVEE